MKAVIPWPDAGPTKAPTAASIGPASEPATTPAVAPPKTALVATSAAREPVRSFWTCVERLLSAEEFGLPMIASFHQGFVDALHPLRVKATFDQGSESVSL